MRVELVIRERVTDSTHGKGYDRDANTGWRKHLITGNRVLHAQIKGRLRLIDGERKTLAEIGKKLGKKVLEEVASIVKPETILAWHRRLVAGVRAAWLLHFWRSFG